MRNLILILITLQLSNCNTRLKDSATQKMKDSAYYNNKQLAYKKEGNKVKFYNYKGTLKNELNLDTRIEKKYNITGELAPINTGRDYMFNLKNGYYCYRDLLIIPAGTIINNGEEFGTSATANEVVETIPKNNLGYPSALKFNGTGQITEIANEKREFDDLGRILKRKIYSGFENEPYKSVEYIYEQDNLKRSKHTGINELYNFTREYVFDAKGQLFNVNQCNKDGLQIISFYDFYDNLLRTKKIYTQREEGVSKEVIEYMYDDKKRCVNEKYSRFRTEETFTMIQIKNTVDVTVNKEYPNKIISTDYIFKDENFIGVKETDLFVNPTPEVIKEHFYIYNKYKQLTAVVDSQGKTIIKFSYIH